MEVPDSEAMARVREGSPEGLAILYGRHHRPLFGFYLRLTRQRTLSEDLVHEVFLRVLRYAGSFREGAPFKPWFYQIARRVHLDHLVPTDEREVDLDLLPTSVEGPHARLERIQSQERLEQALAALSEHKRELLLLSRDPDLTYEDLASLYGCSVGALKVRVHRALQDLRASYLGGGVS